jgi:sulfur carrier protein ThiS
MNRHGFCIFINTVFQGPVPSVRGSEADDSDESRGKICVFATEREAQLEIADFMMTRLREFIDGERNFEEAMTVEEYIVEVDVRPDGTIVDANGSSFR